MVGASDQQFGQYKAGQKRLDEDLHVPGSDSRSCDWSTTSRELWAQARFRRLHEQPPTAFLCDIVAEPPPYRPDRSWCPASAIAAWRWLQHVLERPTSLRVSRSWHRDREAGSSQGHQQRSQQLEEHWYAFSVPAGIERPLIHPRTAPA